MTDLIGALKQLKVQTGSLACLGCGHEHSCGVHGCNIIRAAVGKLARYEQAEKEGRLIEFPCKVGDIVWVISKYGLCKATVKMIINSFGDWEFNAKTEPDRSNQQWIGFRIKISDFGKTVFLTREEAENTLKERDKDV